MMRIVYRMPVEGTVYEDWYMALADVNEQGWRFTLYADHAEHFHSDHEVLKYLQKAMNHCDVDVASDNSGKSTLFVEEWDHGKWEEDPIIYRLMHKNMAYLINL